LILFDVVRVSGFSSPARSAADGPEWTHKGPQNGPQFVTEFWGSLSPVTLRWLTLSSPAAASSADLCDKKKIKMLL